MSVAVSCTSATGMASRAEPVYECWIGDDHACTTSAGRPGSSRAAATMALRAPSDSS